MNLDEVFALNESQLLVSTSPLLLFSCIAVSLCLGWLAAYRYRNTYDAEKSLKMFLPMAVAAAAVFILIGIPALFAIGSQLFGFVSLLLFSNHYFGKR